MRSIVVCLFAVFAGIGLEASGQTSSRPPAIEPACRDEGLVLPGPRAIAVISDLHFGLGAASPYEDFRWSSALAGFLRKVNVWGGGKTDLVIAGDMLELWQHPTIVCGNKDENLGCTAVEIERILNDVLAAHGRDLEALRWFAEQGSNRVVVVPGNHDSALMIDTLWGKIVKEVRAPDGRFVRAACGTWAAAGGKVVVEHGHQLRPDVNRFPDWPEVLAPTSSRLVKTWGEAFVRNRYNQVEAAAPLIDNVHPLWSALKIYFRGIPPFESARQAAAFVTFNLFQTSLRQKVELKAPRPGRGQPGVREQRKPDWNRAEARRLGAVLVVDAMEGGDPMREALRRGGTEQAALTHELDQLAATLTDEEVDYLCDRIAELQRAERGVVRTPCTVVLASALASHVVPERRFLSSRVTELRKQHGNIALYVFGHTHSTRAFCAVPTSGDVAVDVVNVGAFYRQIDEQQFAAFAKCEKLSATEALKRLDHHCMPACYPALLIGPEERRAQLHAWYMDEDDQTGQLISPCDKRCGSVNYSLCKVGLPACVVPPATSH